MRKTVLFAILASNLAAQTQVQQADVRKAIAKALPLLESSAATFAAKRACVSCHHSILPILMSPLARERGIPLDSTVIASVESRTFRSLRGPAALDDAVQAATLNDPTPNDSFLLMAAHAAGIAPDLTTAVYARRLVSWQRDGHWITSDFRPPHSSSVFTATASAIRAIRLYMPEELSAERDACVTRAGGWLLATRPASTEDAAFRLLGLVWAAAPPAGIDSARRDLLALRKVAGGWAELPGYPPDAYSTGQALFALHEAGMPITGHDLRFLLSTQAPDGSWRVRTRMLSPAKVSPDYFPSGFPYQKDEYLSYAGSTWAVMALLAALPVQTSPPPVHPVSIASDWARTALFGTPADLSALLDAGLDPNSKTDRGTTLLMMAAADPANDGQKVQLLLARGANVRVRASSGNDALTIAAAYRGNARALRFLLDAGAEANTPQDVRAKNSPLVFASMTGDLESVKLLLAHHADPSAALSQALTFGYPDIVRALISAGASAKVAESSGINLLHWAVITNHPEVILALIEAGASLNAIDESGYTPLMYAATIDFGDTRSATALLKAGADRSIRNNEGRTALQQARHHQHVNLESVLR